MTSTERDGAGLRATIHQVVRSVIGHPDLKSSDKSLVDELCAALAEPAPTPLRDRVLGGPGSPGAMKAEEWRRAETKRLFANAGDALNGLRNLKVLLNPDAPEIRGWAPAVQQAAQRTVNAAITALAARETSEVAGSSAETSRPREDTPGAAWREAGKPDPHGTRYDCERAALAMGDLTDDELANGAFLNYDRKLDLDAVIARKPGYHPPIAWMEAVKDRIRWLSRKLEAATREPEQRWPKARDLFLHDDMGQGLLRVMFDSDNDVIVAIWPVDEPSASLEFCTSSTGGGKSPNVRAALIALMLAMEQDGATERPPR